MPLTRRAALKGVLATTVGAVTGAGVYGGAYERHHIGVTDATLPVRGLPPALDGLRIALLTDIHHSAIVPGRGRRHAPCRSANAPKPDLVILGGDYVTCGDRAYVGTGRRAAGAARRAARRLRHPRQSRRRPRHAGGARRGGA